MAKIFYELRKDTNDEALGLQGECQQQHYPRHQRRQYNSPILCNKYAVLHKKRDGGNNVLAKCLFVRIIIQARRLSHNGYRCQYSRYRFPASDYR